MKVKQLFAVVVTMVIAMMGAAVAEDVTYSVTMSGVT
jgi:hypothetical protein